MNTKQVGRLLGTLLLTGLLLLAGGLAWQGEPAVQAASVTNYQTYSLESGATTYYAERTTTAIAVVAQDAAH